MVGYKVLLTLVIAINGICFIAAMPSAQEIGNLMTLQLFEIPSTLANETDPNGLPLFDIRYDAMPSHCKTNSSSPVPKNCAEATACTRRSGYYFIKMNAFSSNSFLVECDAHTEGGDWTVIQRRFDGSESFFRTWDQYRQGFGEIEGEYFIGLDKIYALTNLDGRQELMIQFERSDLLTSYAKYSSFAIGNETERFVLKRVGRYTGTAGDSLLAHVGARFSTMDRDNGSTNPNMAITFSSAWWYNNNRISDLNGLYGKIDNRGLLWTGYYVNGRYIKTVKMMVRRYRV
ncbi:microfibril-associated glycoprotein 4 [Stomoxys calcitrans]|uniref:microfibril-associated glycoprotein 4 n=1 Tax=Stomoxys calcitrans TaxID=35570 RepID=UPI0027E29694|nr:microfibril-associated glycoprotein 4 [Stomoxys calcitrans]